jgi:plasmid stabilization system protein ParE
MAYNVIIRPEAAREIQEAFDWYEERGEGLGPEFLRAADACLSSVRRNPSAFQPVHERCAAHSSENSLTRSSISSTTTRLSSSPAFTPSAFPPTGKGVLKK